MNDDEQPDTPEQVSTPATPAAAAAPGLVRVVSNGTFALQVGEQDGHPLLLDLPGSPRVHQLPDDVEAV